ncbi:MAG TPA: ANTAR domain-containing protein [Streptosporangiaceae bacterium]|nr:ANTAR domain-containing protein [Streptosporangiaceae bacterium]
MTTDELAREAAQLFAAADPSGTKSIRQLADLAARRVQACSGAATTLWRQGEAVTMAASHPDLAALTTMQAEIRSGPTIEAIRTGEPSGCADTLVEERWPEFAAAALSRGVRCCVSLVHEFSGMAVTLTLYGVRPRSLDPGQLPLASLLAAFGAASVANAARYGEVRRTASQLQEAARARGVVDQAKGILMHALGCDAGDAFDRMRRVSQTQHIKLTEVARGIIETGGIDAGTSAPATAIAAPATGSTGALATEASGVPATWPGAPAAREDQQAG